ncbi:MAG: hypothetical protein Sapg2KO_17620 [Saprospiraceae bacterium]
MLSKYFTIIALLCLPFVSFSQSKAIEDFYNKYKHHEDISKVELKGWVLKLVAKFTDEADTTDDFLRKITKLRVLSMDEGNLVERSDYNQLLKKVKSDRFEDLMQFKDKDGDVTILIREGGSAVTDILMLISGDDNFTLLSLEGRLKFSDIQNLNLDIDIEGAEHLEKVKKDKRKRGPSPKA